MARGGTGALEDDALDRMDDTKTAIVAGDVLDIQPPRESQVVKRLSTVVTDRGPSRGSGGASQRPTQAGARVSVAPTGLAGQSMMDAMGAQQTAMFPAAGSADAAENLTQEDINATAAAAASTRVSFQQQDAGGARNSGAEAEVPPRIPDPEDDPASQVQLAGVGLKSRPTSQDYGMQNVFVVADGEDAASNAAATAAAQQTKISPSVHASAAEAGRMGSTAELRVSGGAEHQNPSFQTFAGSDPNSSGSGGKSAAGVVPVAAPEPEHHDFPVPPPGATEMRASAQNTPAGAGAGTDENGGRNIVLMFGPRVSGKKIVADKSYDKFGVKTVKYEEVMSAKGLDAATASPAVSAEALVERLMEDDCVHGVILDGYPNTLEEADALDNLLQQKGQSISRVWDLEVSLEAFEKRLCGRWFHPASGRTYHAVYKPPKSFTGTTVYEANAENMKDDETGEPLAQREKDKLETVQRELGKYRDQVKPVLEHYGNMLEYKGTRDIMQKVDSKAVARGKENLSI
eukprot:g18135.t1